MKKELSKLIAAGVAAGLMAGAGNAIAYEAGDIIVRAGYANVSPDDSSDGVAIPVLEIAPISGTEVEVDDGSALGITASYMLSGNLGIELLAATPFSHDIQADLGAAGLGTVDVGDTKHLPPTVSLVWYPLGSSDAFKPYVGVGINYTTFFQEDVDSELEAVTGDLAELGGPASLDLELDDSWGAAVQIGFDYDISENWHLNASVRWIDIDTEAEISSALASKTITVDNVEIDPMVYQINIGYTF